MMNLLKRNISIAVLSVVVLAGMAQTANDGRFSIKVNTDIGLSNSFSASSAVLPGLSSKASESNTGVEFGWTFYHNAAHSLEANIGLAYSPMSTTLDLGNVEYNYAAQADADEDGDKYIRYYEITGLSQKVKISRLTLPIYLSYAYRCSNRVRLHADLGVRLGLKSLSGSVDKVNGEVYSYGVYPQYDNLMIDASYMNGFGHSDLADTGRPRSIESDVTGAVFVGAGAEIRIYGSLSVDVALQYNASMSNVFKNQYNDRVFTSETAPVTYTVADGQRVKSLTDYLSSSKLSQLMLKLGLTYRF